MTKIIFNVTDKSVYVDCLQHADNHDVCTIISTLMNVLTAECMRQGKSPAAYEPGHVLIDATFDDISAIEVFNAVYQVLSVVADEHPEHVRLY